MSSHADELKKDEIAAPVPPADETVELTDEQAENITGGTLPHLTPVHTKPVVGKPSEPIYR